MAVKRNLPLAARGEPGKRVRASSSGGEGLDFPYVTLELVEALGIEVEGAFPDASTREVVEAFVWNGLAASASVESTTNRCRPMPSPTRSSHGLPLAAGEAEDLDTAELAALELAGACASNASTALGSAVASGEVFPDSGTNDDVELQLGLPLDDAEELGYPLLMSQAASMESLESLESLLEGSADELAPEEVAFPDAAEPAATLPADAAAPAADDALAALLAAEDLADAAVAAVSDEALEAMLIAASSLDIEDAADGGPPLDYVVEDDVPTSFPDSSPMSTFCPATIPLAVNERSVLDVFSGVLNLASRARPSSPPEEEGAFPDEVNDDVTLDAGAAFEETQRAFRRAFRPEEAETESEADSAEDASCAAEQDGSLLAASDAEMPPPRGIFHEDLHAYDGQAGLPPPTCSPPPSPQSPPSPPGGREGQCLIREGSCSGDFLKFFRSGETFASAYEVGGKIGEGGFGKVFVATHRALGCSRAVKRLNKMHGRAENHQNELAALLALDHPHVVKLVEYYDEERYLYLVFELCSGPDLFDRVTGEANGRMSELDASMALRHILKSLQCCHSRYRGHFDVKPENFMYLNKELRDLKMIDLGMSTAYDLHRRRNKIKGTAAYMAPEVWRGTYGPEADLWSVGVVLFVMLTGEPALPESSLVPATMKSESKVTDLIRRRMKYATTTFKLSPLAQELLSSMLQHDRHGRMTVREALKHPFCNLSYEHESRLPQRIQDPTFQEAQTILRNLPEIFRAIAEEPMLKRVARLTMAHVGETFPAQHLAFRILDWHGYGELSVAMLEKDMEQRGVEVPSDLDQLFDTIDLLREGYISYLSFLAATLPAEARGDEALGRVTFQILDRNKDNFIDTADLTQVFGNIQVCRGILQEVNFESRLSLSGFLQLMREDVRMSEHPFCWCR